MPKHDQDGNELRPTNDIVELLELVAQKAPGTLSRGGERDLDGAAAFMLQRWREGKLGREVGELDLGLWELPSEMPAPSSPASFAAVVEEDGETVLPLAPEPKESAEERIARLKAELKERSDPITRIDVMVKRHFEALRAAEIAGVGTSMGPARGAGRDALRGDVASLGGVEGAEENDLLSRHQAKKQDRAKALAIKREKLVAKGILDDPKPSSSTGGKSSTFRKPKSEKHTRPHKPSGSRLAAKRRSEAAVMRSQAKKVPPPPSLLPTKRAAPQSWRAKAPHQQQPDALVSRRPPPSDSAAPSDGPTRRASAPLSKSFTPPPKWAAPKTAPGTWASSLKTVRIKRQTESKTRGRTRA